MKTLIRTFSAIVIASGACANASWPARELVVVCIDSRGLVPLGVQSMATIQAGEIFAKAGIELEWDRPSKCLTGGIAVELTEDAPMSASPMALAHVLPPSGGPERITVFYSRLRHVVGSHSALLAPLLGHVLAHEIGHVLLGSNFHSQEGLMQALWRPIQIWRMREDPLSFSEVEVEVIHTRMRIKEKLDGLP